MNSMNFNYDPFSYSTPSYYVEETKQQTTNQYPEGEEEEEKNEIMADSNPSGCENIKKRKLQCLNEKRVSTRPLKTAKMDPSFQPKQEDELFPLSLPYSTIEGLKFSLRNRKMNLYPTDIVRQQFKER